METKDIGAEVPKLDFSVAKKQYKKLYNAINKGLVNSAHSIGLGGIAAGISLCAIGGDKGVEINISSIPCEISDDLKIMYSESNSRFIISVSDKNKESFEKEMKGCIFSEIGRVRNDKRIVFRGIKKDVILDSTLSELIKAWRKN